MDFLSLFPAHERKTAPEMLSLELSLAPPPAPPSLTLPASSSFPQEPSLELWLWPAERESNATANPGSADTANSTTPPHFEGERRLRLWEERVAAMTNGSATAARLVLEKKLYATDVSPSHCRLLLTENVEGGGGRRKGPTALLEMLTEAEKAAAGRDGGGLPVLLVDRLGRRYPSARLKLWRSSDSYVLIGKWADLVRRNELDPCDVVDVYFFRYDGGVGLVVCSRISAREEERRRRDGSEERERRREEKASGMRWHKRRRLS